MNTNQYISPATTFYSFEINMSLAPIASKPTTNDDMTSKDYYFDSYSHYAIHEEMLKDEIRTSTYRKAIEWNPHLFKDKVVMDVGCGTGILSLFAAKAGAKCVIAIDCSNIVDSAKKIIEENNMAHKIIVIKSKIEDLQALPNGLKEVDIIISEWMGYCLFYESMLDTVIYAREKWLKKKNGMIFPDKAKLFLTAIEDRAYKNRKINFWDDVYGFKMSCIKELAISEPLVDNVDPKQIVTGHCTVKEVNLLNVTKEELSFEVPFQLTAKKDEYIHAFMTYFNVEFSPCHTNVGFSTSPEASKYTHWKQTVFYFPDYIAVQKGEVVNGRFKMTPNHINRRDLDVELEIDFTGKISTLRSRFYYKMR